MEFVLVKDGEALPVVQSLTAREWFRSRDQLLRDHPNSLITQRWEFVPGQTKSFDRLSFGNDGVALIIFAHYLTSGAHRARVDHLERFTLVLGRNGFRVEPED